MIIEEFSCQLWWVCQRGVSQAISTYVIRPDDNFLIPQKSLLLSIWKGLLSRRTNVNVIQRIIRQFNSQPCLCNWKRKWKFEQCRRFEQQHFSTLSKVPDFLLDFFSSFLYSTPRFLRTSVLQTFFCRSLQKSFLKALSELRFLRTRFLRTSVLRTFFFAPLRC